MKKMSVLFVFVLLFASLATDLRSTEKNEAAARQVQQLNEELKINGLRWTARVTSMTLLSPAELQKRLGGIEPFIDSQTPLNFEIKNTKIATTLDWRNKNNHNYVTPIRDQGSCGSCWAFGSVAVIESMYRIEKKKPDLNLDYSEQHLVSCTGGRNSCDGGYAAEALNYVKNTGISSETCFRYDASDLPCNPCKDWKNNKGRVRITNFGYVTSSVENREAIFSALQDGPVVGWFEVWSDFESYSDGIYEKSPSAEWEANHIIQIIGYNKSQKYWICKNSWGPDWGQDGFFFIAFGEVGMGKYVLYANGVLVNNLLPVIRAISNKSIKEGEPLSFVIEATDANGDALTWTATRIPAGATLNSTTGQFDWTPGYDQAGYHTVTVKVSDGLGDASKTFYITVQNVKKGILG